MEIGWKYNGNRMEAGNSLEIIWKNMEAGNNMKNAWK